MNPWGLIFVAIGVFSTAAGILDWDWFMHHPKARFMASMMGRGGARVFYILLGIALVVLGAPVAAGVVADRD